MMDHRGKPETTYIVLRHAEFPQRTSKGSRCQQRSCAARHSTAECIPAATDRPHLVAEVLWMVGPSDRQALQWCWLPDAERAQVAPSERFLDSKEVGVEVGETRCVMVTVGRCDL